MKSTEDIKKFYDEDTKKKYKIRNNLRHFLVIDRLVRLGLKSNSKVLEIGCGNGGVTKLIANKNPTGKITAVDISQECISAAKDNLKKFNHIDYIISDMSDFQSDTKFDIVILPDVLEHIPIEFHDNLFRVINDLLEEKGFVFINIPEPKFLEWLTKTVPEELQVVDQALHSETLINTAYKNGLYLKELKSYSIFKEQPDYQYIVLVKKELELEYKKIPTWKIILRKKFYSFINKLS